MNKLFVRIATLFIFDKTKRKAFRNKYEKKHFNNNGDILMELNEIKKSLMDIEFKQNIYLDYYLEVPNIKKARGGQRIRQEENIELLKEFMRLCEKYNLRYWLDYGSLLGAVRHGFTIPWDDDLDVSMPAEEFDKFQELTKNEMADHITYIKVWNDWQSRLIFKNDTGAFLDIYCYNEFEDRLQGRPKFRPPSYNRSIPKNVIFPTKKVIFENLEVEAPNDSDTYLRIKYGKYWELPKSEHIEAGHNIVNEYLNFYNE